MFFFFCQHSYICEYRSFKGVKFVPKSSQYGKDCTGIKIKMYITVICLLFCYETWSVILREEHRLRVLEDGVLRKIFGPKRDEIRGEWRKL